MSRSPWPGPSGFGIQLTSLACWIQKHESSRHDDVKTVLVNTTPKNFKAWVEDAFFVNSTD